VRTLSPGYAGAEAQGIYTTAGDASEKLMEAPEVQPLLSDEHFSVDGTLLKAWASYASLKRIDGQEDPPRVQERCHPSHPYTRGLEDMTNASLQRGRQG
jgi:hypothetical protein